MVATRVLHVMTSASPFPRKPSQHYSLWDLTCLFTVLILKINLARYKTSGLHFLSLSILNRSTHWPLVWNTAIEKSSPNLFSPLKSDLVFCLDSQSSFCFMSMIQDFTKMYLEVDHSRSTADSILNSFRMFCLIVFFIYKELVISKWVIQ